MKIEPQMVIFSFPCIEMVNFCRNHQLFHNVWFSKLDSFTRVYFGTKVEFELSVFRKKEFFRWVEFLRPLLAAVGAKGLTNKIFFLTISAFSFTIPIDKFVSWIGICIRSLNENQVQTSNVRGEVLLHTQILAIFLKHTKQQVWGVVIFTSWHTQCTVGHWIQS